MENDEHQGHCNRKLQYSPQVKLLLFVLIYQVRQVKRFSVSLGASIYDAGLIRKIEMKLVKGIQPRGITLC
jgi:hypothetical protein